MVSFYCLEPGSIRRNMTPSDQVHTVKKLVLYSKLIYGSGLETSIVDALSFLLDGPFLLWAYTQQPTFLKNIKTALEIKYSL